VTRDGGDSIKNRPAHLDTVGVCGSNPPAPTIFAPESGVSGDEGATSVPFFAPLLPCGYLLLTYILKGSRFGWPKSCFAVRNVWSLTALLYSLASTKE